MIPPHLFYQIYLSFLEQNDCTPPKCGELSEYTDSAHTEVEDLSSRCMGARRAKLSLQYASKIKSLPKNPAHNAVFDNKYMNLFDARPNAMLFNKTEQYNIHIFVKIIFFR